MYVRISAFSHNSLIAYIGFLRFYFLMYLFMYFFFDTQILKYNFVLNWFLYLFFLLCRGVIDGLTKIFFLADLDPIILVVFMLGLFVMFFELLLAEGLKK